MSIDNYIRNATPRASIPGSLEGVLDLVVPLFAAPPTPNISLRSESAFLVGTWMLCSQLEI